MLKIVSNTTPLISLLKLSKLSILRELYGQVFIPTAVYNEIEAGRHKNYYEDLSKFDWIKIEQVKDIQAIKSFSSLDAGEAEAIVLATEIHANLVILDEKLGRFHAKHANLNITGTIGVLIRAKKEGIIMELKPLLTELISKDVWISDNLVSEILVQIGEK